MVKLLVAVIDNDSYGSLLELVNIENVSSADQDTINELLILWLETNNYSTENYIVIDNPHQAKELIKSF